MYVQLNIFIVTSKALIEQVIISGRHIKRFVEENLFMQTCMYLIFLIEIHSIYIQKTL